MVESRAPHLASPCTLKASVQRDKDAVGVRVWKERIYTQSRIHRWGLVSILWISAVLVLTPNL